jgi:hypothetical protein
MPAIEIEKNIIVKVGLNRYSGCNGDFVLVCIFAALRDTLLYNLCRVLILALAPALRLNPTRHLLAIDTGVHGSELASRHWSRRRLSSTFPTMKVILQSFNTSLKSAIALVPSTMRE